MKTAKLIGLAVTLLFVGRCAHVPPSGRAAVRLDRYFSIPREVQASVRDAMLRGHVVEGMDAEQVRVVLGEPTRSSRFLRGGAVIDVWLFPGHRFHQGQTHGNGTTLYRLVLIDGFLVAVEPI